MPIRDTIAKGFASADAIALRQSENLRARTFELMFQPDERDPVIFFQALEAAKVDPTIWINLTPADLNEIDPNDRDIDWTGVQAALAAAAIQQARLELVYRPLITKAESNAQALVKANKGLSNEQRQVAATEGVGKKRFEAAALAELNG